MPPPSCVRESVKLRAHPIWSQSWEIQCMPTPRFEDENEPKIVTRRLWIRVCCLMPSLHLSCLDVPDDECVLHGLSPLGHQQFVLGIAVFASSLSTFFIFNG